MFSSNCRKTSPWCENWLRCTYFFLKRSITLEIIVLMMIFEPHILPLGYSDYHLSKLYIVVNSWQFIYLSILFVKHKFWIHYHTLSNMLNNIYFYPCWLSSLKKIEFTEPHPLNKCSDSFYQNFVDWRVFRWF